MTDTDMQSWSDHLRAQEERRAAGHAAYESLKRLGGLADHRVIVYRCADRGCTLLDVLQLPDPVGRFYYRPVYKLSPERNTGGSTPEGRARNTLDGDRRWKAAAMPGGDPIGYTLNCDHLDGIALRSERVEADLAAGKRKVLITREDHDPERWGHFETDSGH
ncbi:hypothetical protein [Kytococcus sedentarius]|uniref:hypothetical protein n=1 Tax=Kytococcus sedentarius TaxID=1276 RepID=UPI00384C28CF